MTKLDAQTHEPHSERLGSGYEIVRDLGQTAGSRLLRIRRAQHEGLALLKRLEENPIPRVCTADQSMSAASSSAISISERAFEWRAEVSTDRSRARMPRLA
jgi:hypothetical protein